MADAKSLITRLNAIYRGLFHALTVGVRGAVIDEHCRVFLVRHTYVRGWHLPGGGVEVGEAAEAALRRELREEAGIELTGPPVLHGVFFNSNASPPSRKAARSGWSGWHSPPSLRSQSCVRPVP